MNKYILFFIPFLTFLSASLSLKALGENLQCNGINLQWKEKEQEQNTFNLQDELSKSLGSDYEKNWTLREENKEATLSLISPSTLPASAMLKLLTKFDQETFKQREINCESSKLPKNIKTSQEILQQVTLLLNDLNQEDVHLGLAETFNFEVSLGDEREKDSIQDSKKFNAFLESYGYELLVHFINVPSILEAFNNYLLDQKALRELKRGEQFPFRHLKYLSEIRKAKMQMEESMKNEKEELFKLIKTYASNDLKNHL